ncbi:Kelch repeat-containing protein [Formosa maritima]|uniref:T9SS type A sorting domain-containing protein n=1 Tax=Formosa maritima TaxID=2592046 RepID=A0A5D0G331_9FLAO|nr:kelch repeat-containing protein [Formosa maritima]TYA53081.1 T9SS type A sorting domain-containing protein [Formosa maritima]
MKHLKGLFKKKLTLHLYIPLFFFTIVNSLYSQTWTLKDEDENYIARHECGFVQVGDKFLLIGGRETQVVDIYDYSNNTWTQGASSPILLHHFQAIEYEGLVWVIGALIDNNDPHEAPAEYIYMYNSASNQWIQGLEIPSNRRRGAGGLVVYNNKFYFVGGNIGGHNGNYQSWFDEYNPQTGIWTQLTDAPHQRDHFQAAVYSDKLYLLGGRQSGGPGGSRYPLIPEIDVYNFTTQTWSTLDASKNLPTPRSASAVAVYEDEIYVIAGEVEGTFNDVEALDPVTNTWTIKNPTRKYRDGTQAIVSGNGIFITAGKSGFPLKDMEYYNEDNPVGSPNIESTFSADEYIKSFVYSEEDGTVTLQLVLTNSFGTTGTFIDSIEIIGNDYSFSQTFNNIFLGANSDLIIEVTLNNTTLPENNGIVTVTYNNSSSFNIFLEGDLDSTLNLEPNENNLDYLKLYPNPTRTSFSINKSINHLQIFDITGKLLKEFVGNFDKTHVFDVSNLTNSIYFVTVKNLEGQKNTIKLIKR